MTRVASTAIRAWVRPDEIKFKFADRGIPFRRRAFGERALVWDTETTTDSTQRLLYGTFGLYVDGKPTRRGIFVADDVNDRDLDTVRRFALDSDLELITRTQFVEKVFHPEVYVLGTLCVGFNLPFDLSRIAIRVMCGKGKNRRRFTFSLTNRIRCPRIRVESASGKAAFIAFAPKKHLSKWESPFFQGRFLDLSTLTQALTGLRRTLRSAGWLFKAECLKSKTMDLGKITPDSLAYAWQDVRATWALFERLRDEYLKHPFATTANERRQPAGSLPITKLYSTASVGKQYLRLLGFQPLLATNPDFNLEYFGYGSCTYFGGRAEVRVRRRDVPVTVVDFTSMYPTVFLLQNLQRMMSAQKLTPRRCKSDTQELLNRITLSDLYNPNIWLTLNRLVKIMPSGDIVPVRYRRVAEDPYGISVTALTSQTSRWYTLADLVAAKMLGGKVPEVLEALEFVPMGCQELESVRFRGTALIDPKGQVFKTVVEERQKAKSANQDKSNIELGRLDKALKEFATSAAYGINFEVNVRPASAKKPPSGWVFSDTQFACNDIHDERPGKYCNPIIASLVTGGSRLMLAMAEKEVELAGRTFAFCDTDSLAIVAGDNCPPDIPCLSINQIKAIIVKFDSLNPYDHKLVRNLLKIEHENVRCWAISAKRYVLFQKSNLRHFRIIKASESGLGGILGRTEAENTRKLARRIWLSILVTELGENYGYKLTEKRAHLINFTGPVRLKLPLARPKAYSKFRKFNFRKRYSDRVKPFGFVQTVIPDANDGEVVQPMAPFERSIGRSRNLPWVDVKSGKLVSLDWSGSGYAGTVPVMGMAQFVSAYATHPEAKAAGPDGRPSTRATRGLLGRLELEDGEPARIGKEVNRLDETEAVSLEDEEPIRYLGDAVDAELLTAIEVLSKFPQRRVSAALEMSERRWRDIVQGRATPHEKRRAQILKLAARVSVNPKAV